MQLLIGMSISRYLPANGTAGLALIFVRGYRRVPAPPPRMIAKTRFIGFFLRLDLSKQATWLDVIYERDMASSSTKPY